MGDAANNTSALLNTVALTPKSFEAINFPSSAKGTKVHLMQLLHMSYIGFALQQSPPPISLHLLVLLR